MSRNAGATANVTGSKPVKATDPGAPHPPRSGRTGGALERVTVNLTSRSSRALDEAVHLTGDTKTDTINRAVQLYAFVEKIIDAGGTVYVRGSETGELERLRFF